MYICFAAGPFHLICINEILCRNKITDYKIYILSTGNTRTEIQINNTIKFLNLKNIYTIDVSKFKFIEILQRIFLIIKFRNISKKNKITFLILDFRNTFMHTLRKIFKKSNFILIDDGFQTFISYRKYLEKKYFLPYDRYENIYGKFIKLINYGLNFRYLLFTKIDVFTIYAKELGLKKKSFNSLMFIKRKVNKKNLKNSKSIVYFIGGKMSERNAITLNQELALIKKINEYWKKKNKTLFYVAKRTSSLKKINEIKKMSIEVKFYDLPLELVFIQKKYTELPLICSTGSTLNKSMPLIYPNINICQLNLHNYYKNAQLNNSFKLSNDLFLKSFEKKKMISL